MAYPSDLARTKDWGTEVLTDADLEGQFDLIITWILAALNSTTGHDHSGTANKSKKIDLTSGVTGNLPGANQGGTQSIDGVKTYTSFPVGPSSAPTTNYQFANKKYADDLITTNKIAIVNSNIGTYQKCSTVIPRDNTIPQKTEGTEILTVAITPRGVYNKLKIDVSVQGALGGTWADCTVALFKDTDADALAVVSLHPGTYQFSGYTFTLPLTHYMAAGGTSEITFKVRVGPAASGGIFYLNGDAAQLYGGKMLSSITVTEIPATS